MSDFWHSATPDKPKGPTPYDLARELLLAHAWGKGSYHRLKLLGDNKTLIDCYDLIGALQTVTGLYLTSEEMRDLLLPLLRQMPTDFVADELKALKARHRYTDARLGDVTAGTYYDPMVVHDIVSAWNDHPDRTLVDVISLLTEAAKPKASSDLTLAGPELSDMIAKHIAQIMNVGNNPIPSPSGGTATPAIPTGPSGPKGQKGTP